MDRTQSVIEAVPGVDAIEDLRVRWHGHQLRIAASIAVDPELTVARGHDIAHALHHEFTTPIVVTIHIEPHNHTDKHHTIDHHRNP